MNAPESGQTCQPEKQPATSRWQPLWSIAANVAAWSFRLVDWAFPKDDDLVAFAQGRGRFSDNSRALFEFITSGETRFRAVWLANSQEQKSLVEAGVPDGIVYMKTSWRGYLSALRARTFIVSHGSPDFEPYTAPSRRTIFFMLWHAITTKKFAILDHKMTPDSIREFKRSEASKYDGMIASSVVDQLANAACFGIDADKVVVTGLPRNDVLVDPTRRQSRVPTLLAPLLNDTIILYAPTFRDDGEPAKFFPFGDFDVKVLNEFLVRSHAYLLLRPHINDRESIRHIESWAGAGLNRLVLASSQLVVDAADLLPYVDVIVTDYSSIYLDLLLADKPAVFVPYDLKEYCDQRGLLYDYTAISPGPQVSTQKGFIAALQDAIKGAPEFASHRAMVRRMFHAYNDGGACRRVAEHLEVMIESRSRKRGTR